MNKILKEDHKKGPLTPVDQKWISQEKFNEILKKIKTIWDFLYKYWTYSILFMIGTFGIIMWKFIFVSWYYPIERNLFHFIINYDSSFWIFMGTFFIWSFIGIFIIFLRIFIWILLFFYVEKKEYAWATYTFIVNTLKGNEYDMWILLGKLMGFLIAFYVAHSAMDNWFMENFPDNNLIREYIDYPIRRFCYSIVPPAKPIHDITQVHGSYEKIPYYVPKGPLSP